MFRFFGFQIPRTVLFAALCLGLLLLLRHLLVRGVNAGRIEEEVLAGEAALFGIGREAARDEFDLAVEVGGHAVDGADEGAAATTDHAHAEFAVHVREIG